jgi:hypothetical protein
MKAEHFVIRVPADTQFLKKDGVIIIKPTLNPSGNSFKKFNQQKSIIIEPDKEIKSKPEIEINKDYDPTDFVTNLEEKKILEENRKKYFLASFLKKIKTVNQLPDSVEKDSALIKLKQDFDRGTSRDRNNFRLDFIKQSPKAYNLISKKYPLVQESNELPDKLVKKIDQMRREMADQGIKEAKIEKAIKKFIDDNTDKYKADVSIYGNLKRTADKIKTVSPPVVEFEKLRLKNLVDFNPEYKIIETNPNYQFIQNYKKKEPKVKEPKVKEPKVKESKKNKLLNEVEDLIKNIKMEPLNTESINKVSNEIEMKLSELEKLIKSKKSTKPTASLDFKVDKKNRIYLNKNDYVINLIIGREDNQIMTKDDYNQIENYIQMTYPNLFELEGLTLGRGKYQTISLNPINNYKFVDINASNEDDLAKLKDSQVPLFKIGSNEIELRITSIKK